MYFTVYVNFVGVLKTIFFKKMHGMGSFKVIDYMILKRCYPGATVERRFAHED